MFVILKKDFIRDFFEYFDSNETFDYILNELEDDDFVEMYKLKIKNPPDVEPYEEYIKFRVVINDKYKLDSNVIVYNTSSIFALILYNLSDPWMSDI